MYRSVLAARSSTLEGRVLSTHYKPFERARLVLEASNRKDDEPPAGIVRYAQIYPTPMEARRRLRSALRKEPRGSSEQEPLLHKGWNAVVWTLPNAPRLRRARICMDPERFLRFLRKHGLAPRTSLEGVEPPELVRYVPRRRALFRHRQPSGEAMYLKVYGSRSEAHAVAAVNLSLLESAELNIRTPRLLVHDRRRRIVVMDEVPGRPLGLLIGKARPGVFAAVGEALAQLHASSLPATAEWRPESELDALRGAMADVERALPALGDRVRGLAQRLEGLAEELSFKDRGPIHGNLFCDQILVQGESVGIVDWDDLRVGDPLFDLARLGAHVVFLALSDPSIHGPAQSALMELIDGYSRGRSAPLEWDRLRWHLATALLLRGKISALRALPDGWISKLIAAIEEAGRLLEGGSSWVRD